MSKKVTMKMFEVYALQNELTQLLTEKLKLFTKMDVSVLLRAITPLIEEHNKLKLEFFKTHGNENEDGTYSLKKDMPKELRKELDDFMLKEVTFSSNLKFEHFKDIETEKGYHNFFMLF
jgi:hypothetical protein